MIRNPRIGLELCGKFRAHLGGRMSSAGLRLSFTDHLKPGVHFEISPSKEYAAAIVQGIEDGLAHCFPDDSQALGIVVHEVFEDRVESSEVAFYKVARMVIDQAYSYSLNVLPNHRVQSDRAKPGR